MNQPGVFPSSSIKPGESTLNLHKRPHPSTGHSLMFGLGFVRVGRYLFKLDVRTHWVPPYGRRETHPCSYSEGHSASRLKVLFCVLPSATLREVEISYFLGQKSTVFSVSCFILMHMHSSGYPRRDTLGIGMSRLY